jgi:ubiquinone/menaquinone biosynthesis C-methylase UbiE
MISIAKQNAQEYDLSRRTEYLCGRAESMPFPDNSFDAVFSILAMHEWSDPSRVFNETYRVLKQCGRCVIIDRRRDMNPLLRSIMGLLTTPSELRPGFLSSVNASYTKKELEGIISKTRLSGAIVSTNTTRLKIAGAKPAVT